MDRQSFQHRLRAVIAADEQRVVDRLAQTLDALHVPYRVASATELMSERSPRTVFCLGSRTASELPRIPGPTVLVFYGAGVTHGEIDKLRDAHVTTVRFRSLTPAVLLCAVTSVMLGTDVDGVGVALMRLSMFRGVAPRLIAEFLHDPSAMHRLTDLRRALGGISRESAQALLRESGFRRAEHLFAALRSASWALMMAEGIDRQAIEQYLAIHDRTAFRRACRRAGVPAPRRGLNVDAFSA